MFPLTPSGSRDMASSHLSVLLGALLEINGDLDRYLICGKSGKYETISSSALVGILTNT